jgi:hypothetical protein
LAFINTTSGLQHELFTYDLNRSLPKPLNTTTNNEPPQLARLEDDSNFNVRAVERGSRLVTINGAKCVLQMPRGNLEGINPRIIMLN